MKKALKITLEVILDIFLALLILISAFSVISAINEKKDGIPHCFGLCTLSVQSGSMSGTFEVGDLIFCTKFDQVNGTVQVGDIISFKDTIQDQQVINTHRVIAIQDDGGFVTKGDANPGRDQTVRYRTDVLAKYNNYKWTGFGNVLDFIKKPVGFICVIVVPIVAYITYQVIYIIRLYSKEKKAEMIEAAKTGTSEDVKDAIIREYLEKQKQQQEQAAQEAKVTDKKVDEIEEKKEAPKVVKKEKEPTKKVASKKTTTKKSEVKKEEKPTEKKTISKKVTTDDKKKSSQSKKPASSGKSKK